MTRLNAPVEACPRCNSADRVKLKLVLIDRADPARALDNRRSWTSDLSVSVTDLKPEFTVPGSVGQFIQGMYCIRCDVGYVPESMAKPPRPRYQAVDGGWRRSNEDGTLGPLLKRIADDPDSRDEFGGFHINSASDKAEVDEVEAARRGSELELRHGRTAHIVAATYAERAEVEGDLKAAQFWRSVSRRIERR